MHRKIKVLGVIPARWGSTRLPGKPLKNIKRKPMIQRVWENASKSKLIDQLIVATDDKRIFDAVKRFGGEAVMTSKRHRSGTDRIGEIAKWRNGEIVVNIQGDEPFIDARSIDSAIKPLLSNKKLNVITLCCRIRNRQDINDPNVVKVIVDNKGYALNFSRLVTRIADSSSRNTVSTYKHIGVYVYRAEYLLKFIKMKQSKLEKAEKLEQLRMLENGERIRVVITDKDSISIDTKEDLKRAETS